jgi:hypothetical protein
MKVARIELHYLPSLEYFAALHSINQIEIELHENFVKQSFRNRCYINTSQGIHMLIVPLREKHGKISIRDVKIDYQQKWQNNHWRAIESAYRNAPYFEFYADELEKIIYGNHPFLVSMNLELLSLCLRTLQSEKTVIETSDYQKEPKSTLYDLRNKITPKEHFSNRPFYQPVAYQQVFGNAFVPNLSFLDLLFCEGPNSVQLIRSSEKKLNK